MTDTPFERVSTAEVFPTLLWVVDLKPAVHEPLNARLLATLGEMTRQRRALKAGENWQTDPDLQQDARFAELCGLIRGAARGALEMLQLDHGGFEITGCWANINPPGAMNQPHNHPNNFLSGTYYVQTPAGAGEIVFADPRPQAFAIFPKVKAYNRFNGNELRVEVKPGRMVLFPAWLMHSVPPNRGAGERISISFNVMFSAFTETMSKPLWQGSIGAAPPRP